MKTELIASERQKEATCHEERKRGQTETVNFLFHCISNGIFRWFRLYCSASRGRQLFRAHLKRGLQPSAIFILLHPVFNWLSLPCPVSQPINFQTRVVPLLPLGVGVRNICVFGGSLPAQIIWDLQFFSSHFKLS